MNLSEQYDVVVVGSGAGGGACAWALAEAGLRVLVLESGSVYSPSDYRLHRADWEQQGFPDKSDPAPRYSFAPLQALDPAWDHLRSWNRNLGRLVPGMQRRGGKYYHVRGVGGSTLHFTGEAHRLHPLAFGLHSRFGVGADWPFGYAELEPYYQTAETVIGVAGPREDPVRWRSQPPPLPPHPHSRASQVVQAGCDRLGMHWVPNSLAVLSRPYDGRPACNYCGQCNRGCPRMDKGSTDVTFIRRARRSGRCTVQPGCRVIRLEAGEGDRVAGIEYLDGQGVRHGLAPRVVVVACGAVETPRLLLLSANSHAPDGLANESGQVGRNFMETLAWVSSGLHPERLGSHRGLPSDGVCWDYNAPDAIPGVVGGCRFSLGMSEADLTGPINYARRVVQGWGRGHKAAMREAFGRVLSIGAIGEFLPNAGTYIDLDPRQRDELGMPLARIHSRLEEQDLRRLDFMSGKCRDILRACGVSELFEEYGTYDMFSSTHVFGTCRMGRDPSHSVIDPDCRSHRWRNLFIVDASVFPSSGGGESPVLTISALAIRAAGRIRERMARRQL